MKTYASFFEWSDRPMAELGVVKDLTSSLAALGDRVFSVPYTYKPDPPDCISTNEKGLQVAFEVTEIVCPLAVKENAKGNVVYRDWKSGELYEHVARQLSTKDSKSFHGGPYDEIIICLFTDEPLLKRDLVTSELNESTFGPFVQITSAYILMSYDPWTENYPVHKLNLKTSDR